MNLLLFAEKLKSRRTSLGITQAYIAENLNITPQTVSKWERGLSAPDIDNLIELSDLLSMPLDELLKQKEYKKRLYAAIDGGGTKTEFLLFADDGHILRRTVRGASNPNTVGEDNAVKALQSGLNEILTAAKPSGIFAGIAGALTSKNSIILENAITARTGKIPVFVRSDILNVIYSRQQEGNCIAAICGTGSSVFAWNGVELTKYGGWGYLFDGAGSGYDIGCDILRCCFAHDDGFGKPSLVTELTEKKLGTKASDLLNDFYKGARDAVASLAPIAFEAYRQGDLTAEEILERNIKRLGMLINAANVHSFGGSCRDVIISGGLTANKDILEHFLRQNISEKMNIEIPSQPQIFGAATAAVSLCREPLSNDERQTFIKNFTDDYNSKIQGAQI